MERLPSRTLAGLPVGRSGRRVAKQLLEIQTEAALSAAKQAARVTVVAEVTEVSIKRASRISAVEAHHLAQAPHAEARLRHLADTGVAVMGDLLWELERSL